MRMRRVEMDRLQELVRLHRMGTGSLEEERILQISPNTEREYRNAIRDEGLLVGAVDEVPALDLLRQVVERRLPSSKPPPQMVSSVESLAERRTAHRARASARSAALSAIAASAAPSAAIALEIVFGAYPFHARIAPSSAYQLPQLV
jgi:hypothetical protein